MYLRWTGDPMWLFVPVRQQIKEFLATLPDYPFREGGSPTPRASITGAQRGTGTRAPAGTAIYLGACWAAANLGGPDQPPNTGVLDDPARGGFALEKSAAILHS